jgi:hypothetical protein
VHCRCLITCARLVEYEVIRARRTNERSSEYSSAGRCIGSTNHLFCRRNKNTCMDYSSSARTKKASPSRIKSTRARNFFARQLSVRCFSVSFLEEEEFGTIERRGDARANRGNASALLRFAVVYPLGYPSARAELCSESSSPTSARRAID